MKDASQTLRVSVWGVITNIPGFPINAYDLQAPDDATFPRVIIESITKGGTVRSKCGFGADWNIQLKISDSFTGRINQTQIDHITQEILRVLVPHQQALLPELIDFKIWKADATILSVLDYEDKTRKYIDKNIQITYSLTEN